MLRIGWFSTARGETSRKLLQAAQRTQGFGLVVQLVLQGLGELRVKETDRVRSMVDALGRFGVRVRLSAAEGVELEGGRLRGAVVDSAGDHRTAMSLAVAGLAAEGETTIRGAECVAKSFPEFFDCLRRLAGSSTVKTVDKA